MTTSLPPPPSGAKGGVPHLAFHLADLLPNLSEVLQCYVSLVATVERCEVFLHLVHPVATVVPPLHQDWSHELKVYHHHSPLPDVGVGVNVRDIAPSFSPLPMRCAIPPSLLLLPEDRFHIVQYPPERKEGAPNRGRNGSGGGGDKRRGGMAAALLSLQLWLPSRLPLRRWGGEVEDEEDVQMCNVQYLTLFFQRCTLGTEGGKKELIKHTTSNLACDV